MHARVNSPISYGAWLRAKRRSMPMSQQKLAEGAGVGRIYVNLIENGKIHLPTKPTRDKFHAVLGTDEQELVDLGVTALDVFGNAVAPEKVENAA